MGEEDRLKKVLFFKDSKKIFSALEFFGLKDFSEKKTLIKLHMGELNNKYYVRPDFVKLTVDALYKKSSKPFLYDTTVLYNSKRKFVDGYKMIAEINGFSKEYLDCEVVIDDEGFPVKIEDNTYYVGKTLYNIKNIIGISHFKGHIASGM